MTSHNMTIEARGVTRRFGRKTVLRDIDLSLEEGDFLTIYGPNGAGKTTFIKVLSTLLKPTAGAITIAGLNPLDNPANIRRKIGLVGHQTFLYDELTAYENLMFYGKMYDIPDLEERIHEVITIVNMESHMHYRTRTLSRGMQQRLSIARAIIHHPSVILLDEPETGLDQHAGKMLTEMMASQGSIKRTIIMTTHSLERGLEMCNRIAIMVKGKIVYEQHKNSLSLSELRYIYHHYTGEEK